MLFRLDKMLANQALFQDLSAPPKELVPDRIEHSFRKLEFQIDSAEDATSPQQLLSFDMKPYPTKKRHFYIWSSGPNYGKSTFIRLL